MLDILLLTKSRTKTLSSRRTISCLVIALVASGRWIEKKGAAPLCYLTSRTPPKNLYTRQLPAVFALVTKYKHSYIIEKKTSVC